MQRRSKQKDDGVSPVVGVMLMLVVTIIIAAVVSIFAGGLMTSTEKAPSITMKVDIKNGGDYKTSHFQAEVLTISEQINTADLKLITTWNNDTAMQVTTALPGAKLTNISSLASPRTGLSAPWGAGTGVVSNSMSPGWAEQQFGNYTLVGGTVMYAYPSGQAAGNYVTVGSTGYGVTTHYEYTGGIDMDGMVTVLGEYWYELRTGDRVTVQLIHTPSGKIIYDSNVVVS